MPLQGVDVNFKDVNVRVKEKVILKDINGQALPGELLAIMGPSGSGKTTLLNVLAGRGVGTLTGEILMNKTPLNKKLKRKIAFVLQEDIFFENLTLRETLVFTARLRLSSSMAYEDKLKKVDDIVEALDLKKCLDTKIGSSMDRGLSGGEKKRTNIGSELLNDPAVLVLDEPTTGLDSTSACNLIDMLQKYAISNSKTVITSIHQPSSQIFYKFHKLILLSEGEVVYFGSSHDVMAYFTSLNLHCYIPHYNAADFILDKAKGTEEELAILHKAAKLQQWHTFNRSIQSYEQRPPASVDVHMNGNAVRITGDEEIAKSGDKVSKEESISRDEIDEDTSTSESFKDLPLSSNVDEEIVKTGEEEIETKITHNPSGQKNEIITTQSAPEQNTNGLRHRKKDDSSDTKESQSDKDSFSSLNLDDRWPSTWWEQYTTLTTRSFRQGFSVMISKIDLIRHVILGAIFGMVYWQLDHTEERLHDIRGVIFFGTVYWAFDSVFAVISTFPTEREVINKERASGMYQLSAYYLAKITSELPLMVIFPTIHFNIFYWMAGLNSYVGAYFAAWSIILLNTLVGQSFGLAISAYSTDLMTAITFLIVYIMSAMMLGGFYVEILPFWLEWTQYLSFLFYVFNLLLRVEFNVQGDPVTCGKEESQFIECVTGNATEVDGETVLRSMDILEVPVWVNLVGLFSFLLFFRLLGYYVLKIKYKPK